MNGNPSGNYAQHRVKGPKALSPCAFKSLEGRRPSQGFELRLQGESLSGFHLVGVCGRRPEWELSLTEGQVKSHLLPEVLRGAQTEGLR